MTRILTSAVLAAGAVALLAGCERPPVNTEQHGYRGTGMVLVSNPRTLARQAPTHQVPETVPAASAEGPKASETYQNVKVLGGLSVGEFTRLMVAMTNWVSPQEGCGYCHNLQNMADDSVYTKIVARRMIQMNWYVNGEWGEHVVGTGVTCYTCHRGNPVPKNVWYAPVPQDLKANFIGDKAGQNSPAPTVKLASLPYDPFTPYLLQDLPIRVNGPTALPTGNRHSIKQAEFTYGLMTHMSDSLGVNCTFCHNTRAFAEWEGSPAQRVTAFYGIRMARDLNNAYLEPLTGTFPANRLGPMGDVAKVNCTTCHQGASKPLNGVSMLKDYPELARPSALGRVLFEVDKYDLSDEARAAIVAVAAILQAQPELKVDVSGYTDRTGSVAHNLELGKQRAIAVRDALQAEGVAADRIRLKKPAHVIQGYEDAARRVDIFPQLT